ncbi:MAG: glutamate mutase L [Candidatus Eisenbacteria sp.]|nr:glutamate mutase L [Candidatus Eisenbacteria bacterium]
MCPKFPRTPTEFCITDVGSTTTKAILFRKEEGWRFFRAEAPTTVELPHEDVTVGVARALRALERETGAVLLENGVPTVPFLSTSSAGGGLAMVVTGLVRQVTSRSAERVALGAGAILLDVIAMDDGRTPYEKIQVLKALRPDMVLLAGGFDGDAISGPVFLAELIREAGLRPKLSRSMQLPVLYAGNTHASDFASTTLGDGFMFHRIENIRPTAERENLDPARQAIQELFMDHVMSQAPGYEKLIGWVSDNIIPTPAAFAKILALASQGLNKRILAIDVGGATTDVFTACKGEVFRTVSANLGMSYSILNVVHTAGINAVKEALDLEYSTEVLWDGIGGKYIRPTCMAANAEEMKLEWAAAVVAIREAVKDHLDVKEGVSLSRPRDDLKIRRMFMPESKKERSSDQAFALKGYDLIVGSGGILSHSPREATALLLTRALNPKKSVDLAVDSAFMFPHLGVLSTACPDLALQLFRELGLVSLGQAQQQDAGDGREVFERLTRDLAAPLRVVETLPEKRVREGVISLRRELAIPGQVLVKPGEILKPDSAVARSRRQFLRPFFLNLAPTLRVDPGDLTDYLLKNVGDEIIVGDLLARRKVSALRKREYRSPVAGRMERILPSGTVVIRERPEDALKLSAVNVAKDLRIYPEKIRAYMRVEEGQEIERGQWIAAIMRPGDTRISRSSARGKVKEINYSYGVVTIEPLHEELEVLAWMPGRVEEVSDRGCIITGRGVEIAGIWGAGGEVFGVLRLDDPVPGCILAQDFTDREDLSRLASVQGAGLVTGGVHLKDILDLEPSFTIVVTEGFGEKPMVPEIRDALRARSGKLILLDGTTELRVGVKRPRIILPEEINSGSYRSRITRRTSSKSSARLRSL